MAPPIQMGRSGGNSRAAVYIKKIGVNDDKSVSELLRRLDHSIEILVKLKLEEVKGERSQKDIILFHDSIGCSPGDIARLLGIKGTNVYPTLAPPAKPKTRGL